MIYEPLRKTSDFAYMASYICMHIFHHTFTRKKKKEMKVVEDTERMGNTGPIHESKRQASVNRLDYMKRDRCLVNRKRRISMDMSSGKLAAYGNCPESDYVGERSWAVSALKPTAIRLGMIMRRK